MDGMGRVNHQPSIFFGTFMSNHRKSKPKILNLLWRVPAFWWYPSTKNLEISTHPPIPKKQNKVEQYHFKVKSIISYRIHAWYITYIQLICMADIDKIASPMDLKGLDCSTTFVVPTLWNHPITSQWFPPALGGTYVVSFDDDVSEISWLPRGTKTWLGWCEDVNQWHGTPWKINGWNLQPSPMNGKENDSEPNLHEDMFHVNFQGV